MKSNLLKIRLLSIVLVVRKGKSCWKYVQLFELVRGRQSGAKAGVGIAIYRADQRNQATLSLNTTHQTQHTK